MDATAATIKFYSSFLTRVLKEELPAGLQSLLIDAPGSLLLRSARTFHVRRTFTFRPIWPVSDTWHVCVCHVNLINATTCVLNRHDQRCLIDAISSALLSLFSKLFLVIVACEKCSLSHMDKAHQGIALSLDPRVTTNMRQRSRGIAPNPQHLQYCKKKGTQNQPIRGLAIRYSDCSASPKARLAGSKKTKQKTWIGELIKLIDVGRKTICKGIESNLAYKTYTPL
jgi:hypothetical protein